MPADVQDRLRALAQQLERDVPHVSTDEVLDRVGERTAPALAHERHVSGTHAGPRRRRPSVTAAAVGLIAILVGGLLVLNQRHQDGTATSPSAEPTNDAVVLPGLIGETSQDAVDQLNDLGLVPMVVQSDDPNGVFDTVMATSPGAGAELTAGSAVYITVAYPPGQGGPLDFATTDEPLRIWPHMSVSDPPATTTGYGLASCSGVATMRAAVDSTSGPEHSYYGTMCSFITLDEPRPSTVVSCATITDGTNYARCQRRTDRPDTDGSGTHRQTTAKGDQANQLDPLPAPTGWDVPATFDATVSAAAGPAEQVDYEDERIAVSMVRGNDNTPVRATIRLPGAVVQATAGPQILQSGLAYAAYQDRTGTIDIVGIVPDEVTEVDVAGTTVPVTNNVWHHVSTADHTLDFVVRSDEGTSASP